MESIATKNLTYGLHVFFNAKTIGSDFSTFDGAAQAPTMIKTPEGISVTKIDAATLQEILALADARTPEVVAWHNAHAGNGVVIRVPAGHISEEPIRIDTVLAEKHRVENIVIFAEQGSEVRVIEHLSSAAYTDSATRSAVTSIIAAPHAKVTHISVQNFGENVTDFSMKHARVANDATVNWVECIFGSDFAQSRVTTQLDGVGASSRVMAMWFGSGKQKFDLRHEVRHRASRTNSDIVTRGAIDGQSKTIYRGLVRIEKGTIGCVGHQKEHTLMLSPDAEIDAMPDLEIAANDVRCGHSAAAGKLNPEKLFYLMSRGFEESEARKMLIEGFFAPIVADMRDAGLEDMVNCLIANRL